MTGFWLGTVVGFATAYLLGLIIVMSRGDRQ